jgi:DNA anti-recombination protein RmuC
MGIAYSAGAYGELKGHFDELATAYRKALTELAVTCDVRDEALADRETVTRENRDLVKRNRDLEQQNRDLAAQIRNAETQQRPAVTDMTYGICLRPNCHAARVQLATSQHEINRQTNRITAVANQRDEAYRKLAVLSRMITDADAALKQSP